MSSRSVDRRYNKEYNLCSCGCKKLANKGKKFIRGHCFRGKKFTEEHRKRISEAQKGMNGNNWRNNNDIGIDAIHNRIRNILPKPEVCEMCGLVPPDDLSNKDHKYSLTNLKDWWYLCTPCHLIFDGSKRDPKTGKFIKRN